MLNMLKSLAPVIIIIIIIIIIIGATHCDPLVFSCIMHHPCYRALEQGGLTAVHLGHQQFHTNTTS